MATVTKRKWRNASGEHEAWMISFTDSAGKRRKQQFERKRDADAAREQWSARAIVMADL